MQYGLSDAFFLNSRYLVFLVNDHIPTNICIQLDSHCIQNVSPQSPLSCAGRTRDVDNCIFEKYVATSCIPCNCRMMQEHHQCQASVGHTPTHFGHMMNCLKSFEFGCAKLKCNN
jgi:hypothetical protein